MNFGRIISIGDIHGDFKIFKRLLRMCKVIDTRGKWTGGSTHVVQMGDTLDGKRPGIKLNEAYLKESGELEIILYILVLDSQAKLTGGRVISILGNHELYPYYFNNDKEFIRDYVKQSDIDMFKVHDIERARFLRPGNLGGVLFGRTRPLILQLGEFLFIHGSVTDSLIKQNIIVATGKVDIAKINRSVAAWLMGTAKIPRYLEDTGKDNPVFSRSYSDEKTIKKAACSKISKQLEKFNNVKHVVMGHSSYSSINTTCKKMLIRTAVSLSRAFGGDLESKKLQVLEIIQEHMKDPVLNIITPSGTRPLK